MPLGVRSFPVAAEDIVVLAAADKCKGVVVAEGGGAGRDRRSDCWHLIDSVLELAAKGVEQQAAHVLALLDAAGNALTMKFWEQLLQPQVDSNWGGAKRGAVRAVEPPFVAKDVT